MAWAASWASRWCPGSDTHQAVQYGCVWTEFQRECSTAAELLQEMQAGRYTITVSKARRKR